MAIKLLINDKPDIDVKRTGVKADLIDRIDKYYASREAAQQLEQAAPAPVHQPMDHSQMGSPQQQAFSPTQQQQMGYDQQMAAPQQQQMYPPQQPQEQQPVDPFYQQQMLQQQQEQYQVRKLDFFFIPWTHL